MINGSDLLTYSHMKQHQAELLREARGLHLARKAVQYRQSRSVGSEHEPTTVDPGQVGVLRPPGGSLTRASRALRDAAGTPPRPGRNGSTPLTRFAARFGTRLIAVGRRLERIDRS